MHLLTVRSRWIAAALCASLLAGCGASSPPADAAMPPPPAAAPEPESSPPPAQVEPKAPSSSDPSPASPPSAIHLASEPSLAAMKPAIRSAKMSVPVDLRYSFSTDPVTGQPTTLHLAAVPRVDGANLNVSIKKEPGVQVEMAPGGSNIQKATAAGVYRKQMAVTRIDPQATRVRVLVTMEFGSGSGFGFFSVPLEQDSVKQQ